MAMFEVPARRGSPGLQLFAGVVAVAATYFYFLLFSEFAFLELVLALPNGEAMQKPLMGLLGFGGIVGSIKAARWFKKDSFGKRLSALFFLCAVTAFLSLALANHTLLSPVAFLLGVCLGAQTVLLASGLAHIVPPPRLGLCVGLGTGLAYGLCNVPWVFQSSASTQAILAGLAALVGSYFAFSLKEQPWDLPASPEHRMGVFLPWLLAFTALVWLDSAAFFIIQHSQKLKEFTWSGDSVLWGNALVHAGVAVLAGILLDRGYRMALLLYAFVLLSSACFVLQCMPGLELLARSFYTSGVSLYSVALVYYAAKGGKPALVSVLFAVAGWFGSAMGIGMAQNLARVPALFLVLAGLAVVSALLLRHRALARASALLLCLVFVCRNLPAEESAEELGRKVYIAEGCIHCHSQYVRPSSVEDVQRWGAAVPLERSLAEKPPLYGNRRQGPDLSSVGLRRSPEWQSLHLKDPRSVRPGSRMPAYAALFSAADERGENLVRYLYSLGQGRETEWLEHAASWKPQTPEAGTAEQGGKLYLSWCTPCHGSGGKGDGPMAAQLGVRPPDFSAGTWRRVNPAAEPVAVARVIKYGLSGSSMAGYEFLTDEELLSLARFVIALHGSSDPKPRPGAGSR